MYPLLLDRSFLWALVLKYGFYAAWGISAFVTGILTIREFSGSTVEWIWATVVALLSLGLSATLLRQAGGWDKGKSEALEVGLTWAWLFLVAIYPFALAERLIAGELSSPNQLFIALGFLVIPAWRLYFLIRKNR